MKSTEAKSAAVSLQAKNDPFLAKEGKRDFFSNTPQKSSFFNRKSNARAVVQRKLTIGKPNDPYEKEADAVADKVVQRLSQPATLQTKSEATSTVIVPLVQRNCSSCEHENELHKKEEEHKGLKDEKVQRKPIFESNGEPTDEQSVRRKCAECEKEEKLQKKSDSTDSTAASTSIESRLQSSKGGGFSMPENTRGQMEESFGTDFSGVRLHTDSSAIEMNKELGAQAFAHGSDIYFNSGKYNPDHSTGQHLLAHELTHTVQQAGSSGSAQKKIQRWPDWVSDAAGWVSDTASDVAGGVADGARAVGGAVVDGAEWVGGKVADGAEWVGDQISAAAQWVVDKIRSVINSGKNYLSEKWESIKEFGRTCFDDIKNGLGELIHFVTRPLSSLMSALSLMNADMLGNIWSLAKSGSVALWSGINSVISGVLKFGEGIWNTISGFISGIFDTVGGLLNNAAFDLLPDWIKDDMRSLFNGLRTLWSDVSSFWTDLWNRLTSSIGEILAAIKSFVDNIMGFGIDKVISMVRSLQEVYDYVNKIFADPEAFIEPFLVKIANKIDLEAPINAQNFTKQFSQKNFPGGNVEAEDNSSIQRFADGDGIERDTARFLEVITGVTFYIFRGLKQIKVLELLRDTVLNMFWPPSTIKAIYEEFSNLWSNEWANAVDSLYVPRNFFDDPVGCVHDIWSNFLILLEFPVSLLRTIVHVLGLLMGYVTIILVLIGAVLGGIAAVEVGVVPGLLVGAEIGFAAAGALGELLMAAYIVTESITVNLAFEKLATARQTCERRQEDMLRVSSSLIGMGVALALQFLMALLSKLVNAIVNAIRGIGESTPIIDPVQPPADPPALPPAPIEPPIRPPVRPPVEVPVPARATPGGGGSVTPIRPGQVAPPSRVPQAPAQGPLSVAAKFEEGQAEWLSSRSSEEKEYELHTETLVNEDNAPAIQTVKLPGLPVAAGATAAAGKGGIDPEKCKDKCDLPFKWFRNGKTVPADLRFIYCDTKKNQNIPNDHHSWPKYLGGPEDQKEYLRVDRNVHMQEFHGNQGRIGPMPSVHEYVQNFLNNSKDYKHLLQGNDLTTRKSSTGNEILIAAMKVKKNDEAKTLRRRVKNQMIAYYGEYSAISKPRLPSSTYTVGLNESENNIG